MLVGAGLELGVSSFVVECGGPHRKLESPIWRVIIRKRGDGSQSVRVSPPFPARSVTSSFCHTEWVHGLRWML